MRIAICGAHGVGKSTISQRIAEEYGLPILHDIVVDAHKI
jgi:adenylate kinase family enzyme